MENVEYLYELHLSFGQIHYFTSKIPVFRCMNVSICLHPVRGNLFHVRSRWADHHQRPDQADLHPEEGHRFCLWEASEEGKMTTKNTFLCFAPLITQWHTWLLRFQDMVAALKSALYGPLEKVILGLMKSTTQYDASEIRGSIKVKDTNTSSHQC